MRKERNDFKRHQGIFKHEPTTNNVDYNQDMDMEYEGMEQAESEAINMMALHGSYVPDDAWNLPREFDYDWSKPHLPRRANLWKNAKTFLEDVIET
jgi:hypothetical protein